MCRSRRELSNAYLLAKIGVDTAENEPLEVWGENSIQSSLHSLGWAGVLPAAWVRSISGTVEDSTSSTYGLATFSHRGQVGNHYRLCWGHNPAAVESEYFPVTIDATFTLRGPHTGLNVNCLFGRACTIQMTGYEVRLIRLTLLFSFIIYPDDTASNLLEAGLR